MEKFLLILKESGTNRREQTPGNRQAILTDLEKWIDSLKKSGNYNSGVHVALGGQFVTGDELSKNNSLRETRDHILRFDTVMAENFDQAVSIAQTNPMVMDGTAAIEVRMIMALVR